MNAAAITQYVNHVGTIRAGLVALSVAIQSGELPVPDGVQKYAWLLMATAVFLRAGEKNPVPTEAK